MAHFRNLHHPAAEHGEHQSPRSLIVRGFSFGTLGMVTTLAAAKPAFTHHTERPVCLSATLSSARRGIVPCTRPLLPRIVHDEQASLNRPDALMNRYRARLRPWLFIPLREDRCG